MDVLLVRLIQCSPSCYRWLLLPPEYTHLLYDRHARQLPPDFYPVSEAADVQPLHEHSCEQEFPNLIKAAEYLYECVQVLEVWHLCV